jgi:hypothetical protein
MGVSGICFGGYLCTGVGITNIALFFLAERLLFFLLFVKKGITIFSIIILILV